MLSDGFEHARFGVKKLDGILVFVFGDVILLPEFPVLPKVYHDIPITFSHYMHAEPFKASSNAQISKITFVGDLVSIDAVISCSQLSQHDLEIRMS